MHMTEEGFDLIKSYEGFRSAAYADPVGILTIGFGHTSMAGAPRVEMGMTITRDEAEVILRRDVARVALQVESRLKRPLSSHQFSALVSFCFNVGENAFARSSVLDAANKGDFGAVPRRLALWNKAGGKILPGLVRRRAAEAALFASESAEPVAAPDGPSTGKTPLRSTSILAAVVMAVLAALQAMLGDSAPVFAVLILCGIFLAAAWIIRERILKSRKDGI